MKKVLWLLIVTVFTMAIASSALAVTFKDVPADHWAAPYVLDLIKLGVTNGYPDGTFRGTKNISRYEAAVFIAKLAKAVGGEEIQTDLKALKQDVAALKKSGGLPFSGSYSANWQAGNLLAESGGTRGGVTSYRLALNTVRDLGNGADVKVNLDTMDYGFYDSGTTTTGGVLATELLDIESNLSLDLAQLGLENPVKLTFTLGPGSHQHIDATGVLSSETGVTYVRPNTSVVATTSLWGLDVSGGYIVPEKANSGLITTSQVIGAIGYNFIDVPMINKLRLAVAGDYVSSGMYSSTTRDVRGSIGLAAPLGDKIEASGTLGLGGADQKNWMLKGEVALKDLWQTGTEANIMVSKVGAEFINPTFAAAEFDFAGFDQFMRPLTNGTVNVGGQLVQNVSDDIKLVGKGDVRLSSDYKYEAPSGRLTAQGGVLYSVAPNTTVDASYRVFQDKATKDTSDIAAVGLMYQF
ncbi:hypothetical protein COT42_06760 [Candidatus Saganbacteria bacterium CG08_land_8_20_14_0_20_45_16]|uniref:SLH domain-containing protein n=1 Tax=Candidatus Saganbacteria bacterium CG08_land_8_20_14_0_20_45_16 TaxID=2014293 RepID=A0A2H0XVU9_UNCSA|nr:MAG: hypothetical protein COT42_06760 [Candidatus Saganbacteria bacterium CG08_land_8_20_14_0_20_45_16]